MCRDRHAAEDVVQEACMRAWSAWGKLRDPAVAKSWLMTIVRNESARRLARAKADASLDEVDEVQLPAIPSCEAGVETAQILAQLPASYREPLLMQVLGGFSCAEIAATLGTTEGAVMTRLTRARQALRRRYAEPLKRATG
jgi:RNA polymerase sigma-70 factor (ECF subfamily)